MKFEKEFATDYINSLLKKYGIMVYKRSVTSSGHAFWKTKKIKIPHPTSIDRFGVCLHEIKHILDGPKGSRYEQEFACDLYALNIIKELGYEHEDWEKRMRWHSLSRIAMAHNRRLDINKIKPEIKEFFKEIDFSTWKDKSVFVSSNNDYGYKISLNPKLSLVEVKALLEQKGMRIEKSMQDDSTYNKWVVFEGGSKYTSGFENLSEVVSYYNLNK